MKTSRRIMATLTALVILVSVVLAAVISLLPTKGEITEEEAKKIADEIISEKHPDMVGSDVVVSSYSMEDRNICSVLYRKAITVQTPENESTQLLKIVIVEIDKSTGEYSVAVSC